MLVSECVEYDRLVDSVQELGAEDLFYFIHYISLHPLVIIFRILFSRKSQLFRIYDRLRSRIGSHDDHCVRKVYFSVFLEA